MTAKKSAPKSRPNLPTMRRNHRRFVPVGGRHRKDRWSCITRDDTNEHSIQCWLHAEHRQMARINRFTNHGRQPARNQLWSLHFPRGTSAYDFVSEANPGPRRPNYSPPPPAPQLFFFLSLYYSQATVFVFYFLHTTRAKTFAQHTSRMHEAIELAIIIPCPVTNNPAGNKNRKETNKKEKRTTKGTHTVP